MGLETDLPLLRCCTGTVGHGNSWETSPGRLESLSGQLGTHWDGWKTSLGWLKTHWNGWKLTRMAGKSLGWLEPYWNGWKTSLEGLETSTGMSGGSLEWLESLTERLGSLPMMWPHLGL